MNPVTSPALGGPHAGGPALNDATPGFPRPGGPRSPVAGGAGVHMGLSSPWSVCGAEPWAEAQDGERNRRDSRCHGLRDLVGETN